MILYGKGKITRNSVRVDIDMYICNEYHLPNGIPMFTFTYDINKAKHFTYEQCSEFNNKYMLLGIIDKPFNRK